MDTLNRLIFPIVLIILLTLSGIQMNAQNSVSIASTAGTVSLAFMPPSEPGNSIWQVNDNSNWLNYNITAAPGTIYSIMVQLESPLPEGFQLQLAAGSIQGNQPNSQGIITTSVILNNTPQLLIGNIGTIDTGTGAYIGHQLTYTMNIFDYSTVKAKASMVNVLFTITQL